MTSMLRTALLALLAACTANAGKGTVVGTVHGATLAIKDAISANVYVQGSTSERVAEVMLANDGDLCSNAANDSQIKGYAGVTLTMFAATDTTITPAGSPGDYTIGATTGNVASWNAVVTDSMCQDVIASEATATAGTVTLAKIEGNAFTGSFDVTLDSGEQVTGTFEPAACAGMQNLVDATTPPTCK
jgi:hypothetical protein